VIKMEIWGELSLPSDPFALTDSNMFESIDDSEHDQYEDEFEADGHNHEVNSYVCDAAKALESVLSEALGKYPLIFLDDQTKTLESMQNYSTNSRTQGTRTKSKIKRTISASLFGDCLDSCDETSDLLEIWEEDELDDEISSIEEEIERIQQQKYVKETSIPYSPRSESPCSSTLFFEEYSDFLQDPEEIPDSSSDSSPLNSPLSSPPQSFPPPPTPINEDDSSDTAHASGSSCDENESSLSVAISVPTTSLSSSPSPSSSSSSSPPSDDSKTEDKTSKKRTAETEKPNTREKRKRNTKNCVSKSIAAASLSIAVIENSSESPSKPTRRKKSKKRTTPKKKKMEAIFKSEEVLKIKRVGDDEVDVNVDIGDASDFTNY